MEKSKRDKGRTLLLGGTKGTLGALRIASQSAIRAGAGLVSPITKNELVTVLETQLGNYNTRIFGIEFNQQGLEKTCGLLEESQSLGFGIGIDINENKEEMEKFTIGLFNHSAQTVIFDGQVTAILSEKINLLQPQKNHIILLNRKEIIKFFGIENPTDEIIKSIAHRTHSTIVLKGEKTKIISSDHSDIIFTGNYPQMLVAGAGDVLLGIISSYVGQGINHKDAIIKGIQLRENATKHYIEHTGDSIATPFDIVDNIRFVNQ